MQTSFLSRGLGDQRLRFYKATVMCIIVLAIAIETTAAASTNTISRRKRHSSPRWTIPCGPGHVAIASTVSRKSLQIEEVVMEQFQTIKSKAMETKDKVLRLEELYVSAYFLHKI